MRLGAVGFLIALALGLLAAPLAADTQQPPKVPRIGVLLSGSLPNPALDAFRDGLRQLGYLEGKDVALEIRWAGGKVDQLPALAAELVRLKVDVIVTGGESAVRAVKDATRTIPIVMGASNDPVGTGLVASLAHPGGNITGSAILSPELSAKRLALLKEALPRVSRIAILADPAFPGTALDLKETQAAAQTLGLKLRVLEVRAPDDFEGAFSLMAREPTDALITLADPFFTVHRRRIVELVNKSRRPAMYYWREFVDAGGLMSYGPSLHDLYRRAAIFVDKILKGAKPADLPVEQPTNFELVINLKTAKALGLTIPQSVLIRADEVIQ